MAGPKNLAQVGILTGGGDCPGLNPVIRAVTRRAIQAGIRVVGIRNGWKGLIQGDAVPLDLGSVSGILPRGGTILGTSRTNPYKQSEDVARLKAQGGLGVGIGSSHQDLHDQMIIPGVTVDEVVVEVGHRTYD